VSNLVTIIVVSYYNNSNRLLKRVRVERYYSTYSKIRYNSYTYKVEIEDVYNSKESKE
jgi:hypothetical protein